MQASARIHSGSRACCTQASRHNANVLPCSPDEQRSHCHASSEACHGYNSRPDRGFIWLSPSDTNHCCPSCEVCRLSTSLCSAFSETRVAGQRLCSRIVSNSNLSRCLSMLAQLARRSGHLAASGTPALSAAASGLAPRLCSLQARLISLGATGGSDTSASEQRRQAWNTPWALCECMHVPRPHIPCVSSLYEGCFCLAGSDTQDWFTRLVDPLSKAPLRCACYSHPCGFTCMVSRGFTGSLTKSSTGTILWHRSWCVTRSVSHTPS